MKQNLIRVGLILSGGIILATIYILQRDLFYSGFLDTGAGTIKVENFSAAKYITSKTIRFLFNDGASLLIIYGIFQRKDFLKFGFGLFLVELLILLPVYFLLVTFAFDQTRFFLQHIHRLVVNPVLMMLLIPAFYYQLRMEKN
ncbi:MAG: exosortase F system-associated protein [Cryomorphaceae bacterium]|nr:exosortase F system-associated protein [Cryomorphaceae bacterium]